MIWPIDHKTQQAAINYPLHVESTIPAEQNGGKSFNTQSWNDRVIQPAKWPKPPVVSSPTTIIEEFSQQRYLQGLALVASWGRMWRQPDRIWGTRDLADIHQSLHQCAISIKDSQSIEAAWNILTGREPGQLGWSRVMASKTLHFLCRSLGFNDDPPVVIDKAELLNHVWQNFIEPIPPNERPLGWVGNELEAYYRFMTAMLTWASQKNWTTTQIEATVFHEARQRLQ